MLGAGDCILVETNSKDGVIMRHLFVILFDGEPYTGNTIITPISTLRSAKQDSTVILRPGDHEFIKVTSFVDYRSSRTSSITFINKLIEDGKASIKPPVKKDILLRIREGVRKSKMTRNDVLIAYSNQIERELNRK